MVIQPSLNHDVLYNKLSLRLGICRFIVAELYNKIEKKENEFTEEYPVSFSLFGLYKGYKETATPDLFNSSVTIADVADALLYLSKIGAMKLEGGFLVLYNGMDIKRLVTDNRIKYKIDDYRLLDEFYKQKIRQIHIVGEYANLMVRDYDAALHLFRTFPDGL